MGHEKYNKKIRKYAKLIGMNAKVVRKLFWRGDTNQKMKDLLAMDATIYAKAHVKPGTPYEEQQAIMSKFMEKKKEMMKDIKWPEIKIKEEHATG
ncbi:MAG TPA: hypothetical protein VNX68_16255 [Nitrosopumilaceae archaeon]|jgi:hypothetical protein|nr:hypothetical protein [Nitrosopumilaceae archaeon]